jgi:lipopolysaccharide/colanic/teichoic acid biosynthesis glycosyltransferase
MKNSPVLELKEPRWKRPFDLILSGLGILMLCPVMVGVAVALKVFSPGPVFFKQRRLTQGMREFVIYKFRTMEVNYDKEAKGIQTAGNSSAITPMGRILRKTKLDELPQLFNIWRGEMSFVGPRPELPRRLAFYSEADKEIFRVRSGVSSPASVILADEEYLMQSVDDPEAFYIGSVMPYKIELNKDYIHRMNLWLDIKVILATALRVAGCNVGHWVVTSPKLREQRQRLLPLHKEVGA